MADKSKIEWTRGPDGSPGATWNPIRAYYRGKVGWYCEHVTPGCENCYAERMNQWRGTGLPFKPGHRKDVHIYVDLKTLEQPRRWSKRMVFVCSMTDLFADFVTDDMIDKVFAIMQLCQQHTFQVLTKRAERMRRYIKSERHWIRKPWPLSNVWLGVSAERQEEADARIPHLLATPAAVRFLSAEPLLGPIDLGSIVRKCTFDGTLYPDGKTHPLEWVIVGGESGPKARPMNPQWARDLRDQCQAAGVAYFFKQFGEYAPQQAVNVPPHFAAGEEVVRVGKKAAGRLLDGREWNEMPR